MTTNSNNHRESGHRCAVVASRLRHLTLAVLLSLISAHSEAFVVGIVTPSIQRCRQLIPNRAVVHGNAFFPPLQAESSPTSSSASSSSGRGFGKVAEEEPTSAQGTRNAEAQTQQQQPEQKSNSIPEELLSLPSATIKDRLLDLLPRMTGTADEFRSVEGYINALEDGYTPVQTLPFLNLAMGGEWQLLFSTNRLGVPNTRLRLRELVQRVETNDLEGTVTNVARWDLAEGGETFDATGTFSVRCRYEINQGSRMNVDLDDHLLEPARGSPIPKDVPGLVGMLHGSMPAELFDPDGLAMDTTYLDGDLRIVRLTGSAKLDGVRNIFIRSGAVEINPTNDNE